MDTKEFATRDEYIAHLEATYGDNYAAIVKLACQLISFDRLTQEVINNPDPVKALLFKSIASKNFAAAMSLITKVAGLSEHTRELSEASHQLYEITAAETMRDMGRAVQGSEAPENTNIH